MIAVFNGGQVGLFWPRTTGRGTLTPDNYGRPRNQILDSAVQFNVSGAGVGGGGWMDMIPMVLMVMMTMNGQSVLSLVAEEGDQLAAKRANSLVLQGRLIQLVG